MDPDLYYKTAQAKSHSNLRRKSGNSSGLIGVCGKSSFHDILLPTSFDTPQEVGQRTDYMCGHCYSSNLSSENIIDHFYKHHGLKWPTLCICPDCDSCFGSHVDYSKHRLTSHPLPVDGEIFQPIHDQSSPNAFTTGEFIDSCIPNKREESKVEGTSEYDSIIESLAQLLTLPSNDSFIENIYQF